MNRHRIITLAIALIAALFTGCAGLGGAKQTPASIPRAVTPPSAPVNPQVATAAINRGAMAVPAEAWKTPDDGITAYSHYDGGFLRNIDGSIFLTPEGQPVPERGAYFATWNAQGDAIANSTADITLMEHGIMPTALKVTLNAAGGIKAANSDIIAQRTALATASLSNLAPALREYYTGQSGIITARSDGLVQIITASGDALVGVLENATPTGRLVNGVQQVVVRVRDSKTSEVQEVAVATDTEK